MYRLTRIAALFDVATIAGWAAFLLSGQTHLDVFSTKYDVYVRVLESLSIGAVVITIVPLANFVSSLRGRPEPWWTKVTDALVLLSALAIAWIAIDFRLAGLSLNY